MIHAGRVKICTKSGGKNSKNKNADGVCECVHDDTIQGRKTSLPHFLCVECKTTYVMPSNNARNKIYQHFVSDVKASKLHEFDAKKDLRKVLHDELYLCVIMEMRADDGLLRVNKIGLPSRLITKQPDSINIISESEEEDEKDFNLPSDTVHSKVNESMKKNIIPKSYENVAASELGISDDDNDLHETLNCMCIYIYIYIFVT